MADTAEAGCIFCAIAAGSAEQPEAPAVMNLVQQHEAPGHVLVIPRRHIRVSTRSTVPPPARVVRAATAAEGITLIQNNEPAGGQDVFRLHIHVIPRRSGDGGALPHLRRPAARAALERLAASNGDAFHRRAITGGG